MKNYKSLLGESYTKMLAHHGVTNNKVTKSVINDMSYAMRICLPYQVNADHSGQVTVSNREYLPLGHIVPTCDGLDEKRFLGVAPSGEDKSFYLYNDGCKPWDSVKNFKEYCKKLECTIETYFEPKE